MATAVLLPPGAREASPAPAPERCYRCRGMASAQCERCKGCGWEFARWDLPASRTYGLRRVRFEPSADGMHRLFVGLAKTKKHTLKWTEYMVCESENQWGGRSFVCAKVGTPRTHNVFLGKSVSCECEGTSYASAAKANQRAWEAEQAIFPTFGCVHADSLHALLLAGWFDLNAEGRA